MSWLLALGIFGKVDGEQMKLIQLSVLSSPLDIKKEEGYTHSDLTEIRVMSLMWKSSGEHNGIG